MIVEYSSLHLRLVPSPSIDLLAKSLVSFLTFYNVEFVRKHSIYNRALNIRDVLSILQYFAKCSSCQDLSTCYVNAIQMIVVEAVWFLDCLEEQKLNMQSDLEAFVAAQGTALSRCEGCSAALCEPAEGASFGAGPFRVPVYSGSGLMEAESARYFVSSEHLQMNLKKVLRALQLDKAVMLEGLPSVGKSSLIEYIATQVQVSLVKIQLSEQTDISDLLGSDYPTSEGGEELRFRWFDGALLDALKQGKWVLLQELNLAS